MSRIAAAQKWVGREEGGPLDADALDALMILTGLLIAGGDESKLRSITRCVLNRLRDDQQISTNVWFGE